MVLKYLLVDSTTNCFLTCLIDNGISDKYNKINYSNSRNTKFNQILKELKTKNGKHILLYIGDL